MLVLLIATGGKLVRCCGSKHRSSSSPKVGDQQDSHYANPEQLRQAPALNKGDLRDTFV